MISHPKEKVEVLYIKQYRRNKTQIQMIETEKLSQGTKSVKNVSFSIQYISRFFH